MGAFATLTGSVDPTARAARRPAFASLAGSVHPARHAATVVLERRFRGRWTIAGWTRSDAAGRYRVPVPAAGVYRIRYRGVAGAPVRVRAR